MDFSDYKRATMQRQVERRMGLLQVSELRRYRAMVTDNPLEARALTSALLVTVTSFFRDPAAWQSLAEPLRAMLADDDPPGRCGSGYRAAPPGRRPTPWA
jgi:two-component system CheB/CheR fusion protein